VGSLEGSDDRNDHGGAGQDQDELPGVADNGQSVAIYQVA